MKKSARKRKAGKASPPQSYSPPPKIALFISDEHGMRLIPVTSLKGSHLRAAINGPLMQTLIIEAPYDARDLRFHGPEIDVTRIGI